MKSKRIILFLIFLCVCNVFQFYFFKNTVEIVIGNTGQNTTLSLFYDNLTAGYPFDDSHMTSDIPLVVGEKQKISLNVPLKNLNKLRIDFGTIPSSFTIYSFSIVKSPFYEMKLSNNDFLNKFSNKNEVNKYTITNDTVQLQTNGQDGHIFSLNLLEDAHYTLRYRFFQNELLFVLGSFLLAFISNLLVVAKKLLVKAYRISRLIVITPQNKMQKVYGFILIFIYSAFSAYLLDVIIFRVILKVSKIYGFETLYHYFSSALNFSFNRIYFFFTFFFVIGLIFYLGKRKAIRFRYILALILLILLVCGRFSGSSLGFYDGMLHGNTTNYTQSTLLGIPEGIRGDEWATEKPYYFAQVMGNNDMPYFNKNLSFDGNDMVVSAFAPVKDIVILARPDLWGFLILPPDYAFSFYWWSRLILLFMASFEMGYLLTKRYRYAIYAALIITFAPPVQWWLSQTLMIMLMSGQYALVLFNKYLKSEKLYIKSLNLLGIGFFGLVYTLTMYPATQVPLAYVFLSILIYLCIENKERRPFAPIRIVQYIFAMLPFAGILLHFYINSKPAMDTIMNTVYPGSSRPWISLPWDYELYQFVNVFTSNVQQPDFLNASEISQFFTFFPFAVLVTIVLFWRYRCKVLLPTLLLCSSLLLWLFSRLPQMQLLNKITLLSFTYPVRITFAYGFGFTLLIISLLPLLEKKMKGLFSAKKAGAIAVLICFLTLCTLTNSDNVYNYFKSFPPGKIFMILIVVLLSYMGYLLVRGSTQKIRQFSMFFVLLSVGSTCLVNPITQGLDSMFEKTTMAKIREINAEDSGRWMVSGSPTISNLVTAQGVARTTGTYYYPDWKMMDTIDKQHQYVNLWNQYAHIDMRLTDKALGISTFDYEKSEKVDGTNRIIYIPIKTAKELNIKYIFTDVPIPPSIINDGKVTLLYKDKIDPWSIYRLN